MFLFLGLANQGASAVATYVGADVGWTSTNALRKDLADHCLRLDMTYHNERTPGEWIERIDGDVTNLSNFLSQFVVRILTSVLLTIGVLLLLFRENPWVGLALACFACGSLAVLLRCRNLAVPAFMVQREASSRLFGLIEENLSGIEDIRANAGGPYVLDRFYRTNYDFYHASRRAWMLRFSLFLILLLLFVIGDVLAIGMGVYLHLSGLITVGTVFLFFHYTEMLRNPISQITNQLQDLQNASASIRRVDELFKLETRIRESEDRPLPAGPLEVEFDRVTFGYGGHDTVLRDVSFGLRPGTVLGLLGRTGSGKTTVTRLLFRLYDVRCGAVRLGGVDVRSTSHEQLRDHIGMVTQDVQLFQATVRDNLAFFDSSISDDLILEVVDRLGLRGWLERLPNGLDTPLAAGGKGLSAGEAQLLACIRVFLKDPGLVILDEPSSRLDPATERLLQQAWSRLLQDRTGILIAHRLSTVRSVDEIMILENGQVLERGPRAALEADPNSHFYSLLQTGLELDAP